VITVKIPRSAWFALLIAAVALPAPAADTVVWDSSGNGMLSGTYNFREVMWRSNADLHRVAIYGSMVFDGNGGYTLSYMSQMGGWAVEDYAVNFAKDPVPYLRLGYASYLSSWALLNSGTAESNYGYWYPGKENDGGASGGFEPRPWEQAWLGNKIMGHGPWWYSGEIDLGSGGEDVEPDAPGESPQIWWDPEANTDDSGQPIDIPTVF
jgi:hypothetical protein